MRIQHNVQAINSHRNMGINNSGIGKNLEKLSSGFRINRAGDDAAGLAISEKMRGQIRGLAMAEQNTSNGINLIQTAEGGLNETHAILQRMRELAVAASNGTYQNVDREQQTKEFEALKSEIDRIADSTHYNGIKLLNGNLQEDATVGNYGAAVNYSIANGNTDDIATVLGSVNADEAISGDFEFRMAKAEGAASTGYVYQLTYGGQIYSSDTASFDVQALSTSGQMETVTVTFSTGSASYLETGADFASLSAEHVSYAVIRGTFVNSSEGAASSGAYETFTALPNQGENLVFQIGANGGDDQRVKLGVADMSSRTLGLKEGDIKSDGNRATAEEAMLLKNAAIGNVADANRAIDVITSAANQVSGQRADLGALQNRLEHTMNNLGTTKENLTAAESTIRDVDMAKEMMDFTKNNILVQASQAMLAQANQLPQGVLQLLR